MSTLAALLAGRESATAIEIWPCQGEPLRVRAADVRAAPRRHLLVLTRRRGFKLLDTSDGERALLKTIAAVRIID